MYRERRSVLPGAVVWTREVPAAGSTSRVLPDGCMDLIVVDDTLLVAGPDTTAERVTSAPGTRYTAVRFGPGVGPGVLGVPAHELRDTRVPLDAVWPARAARRLRDRLATADDPARALEQALADRAAPPDPLLAEVAAGAERGDPVAEIAAAVGLSERQLHRRCRVGFGYGPKTLARILRLQRAVEAARAGVGFATLAAEHGYADQAHLSREVRALAGVPLGELVPRDQRAANRSTEFPSGSSTVA